MRSLFLCLGLAACTSGGGNGDDDGPRGAYPGGPYGTSEGSVIQDLSFVDDAGNPLALSDIHADGKNEILLVTTAAGWCTACIEEQPALEDLYQTYKSRGLVVMVAVFENGDFEPATVDVAHDWREQQDVTFTVVADSDFQFAAYYDTDLTPMNMLVELDTMKMLRISTSFDRNAVEAIIEAKL